MSSPLISGFGKYFDLFWWLRSVRVLTLMQGNFLQWVVGIISGSPSWNFKGLCVNYRIVTKFTLFSSPSSILGALRTIYEWRKGRKLLVMFLFRISFSSSLEQLICKTGVNCCKLNRFIWSSCCVLVQAFARVCLSCWISFSSVKCCGGWLILVPGSSQPYRYYLHGTYTCNSEQLNVISVKHCFFHSFSKAKGNGACLEPATM